jgi:hypothetical protein
MADAQPPGVTHRCPPEGSGLMPCCGRTPFEVSRCDRITLDPALVTCTGAANPSESGERPRL